ncbi:MAG: hypothetical protein KDG57_09365, partial [Rhodoferax sp.]|nr:hypothetical protein [Rhodoferax sp.]
VARAMGPALLSVAVACATAAPLDALLGAWPERAGPSSAAAAAQFEAGLSFVNRHIDFSDPEDDPELAARAARGDYRAAHLSGGWAPAPGWWLAGTLAQRELDDGVDRYRYVGWQLAAQWRWHEPPAGSRLPAMALRLGAWGHQAGETATTTPVRVPGAVLDTVTIRDPADRTLQLDAIASWTVRPGLELGVLASVGDTRLSYGGLTATTRRNGCSYDLLFTGNDIFGTLAEPCNAPGGVIEQFFDSSGSYGVDVPAEIAWRGRFVQWGVNLRGETGAWTWAAGFLWHRIRRDGVDDVVAERGRSAYAHNRQLVLDGGWRFRPGWALFLRADLGERLFFNELPVTYNSSTAGRFGSRLSLLTAGLRAQF